ncbi:hypothetical protein D9Q98_010413 [Chlorella vulgaris]|uniref:Polysaccharide pyruvyl transferase domain-containing protein n=1 Tax=Chlorella vulgaris TaxID=3077 RepID=A0A9D4TRV3_CHLVU|nr:hypothetical protein D9Q98_010413 [Chlorella vulgaris]
MAGSRRCWPVTALLLGVCFYIVLFTKLSIPFNSNQASPARFTSTSADGINITRCATALSTATPKVLIGWAHSSDLLNPRPSSGLTLQEAQQICTDNCGNLVWALAALRLLDPDTTKVVHIPPPFTTTEPISALLFPEANLLLNISKYDILTSVASYTKYLSSIVSSIDVPVMLIGIGTQVHFSDAGITRTAGGDAEADNADLDKLASQVSLHPEQQHFMQQIDSTGGFTTVRGDFTAAVLTANKLQSSYPLGCPSLFLNHNMQLGAVLRQKWDALLAARSTSLRVAVNLPNIGGDKPFPVELIQLVTERLLKAFPNSVVIMQTPGDEHELTGMHERHGLFLQPSRVRFYYDVDSWVEGLKSCCDLVFGFRIHCTMTGVAAEVPGVLLAPDLRMKELAEAMRIPSVDLFDMKTTETSVGKLDMETFNLFDFLESVDAYKGFDERRQEVAQVYAREFERLGVPLHPGVVAIADGVSGAHT